MVAPRKSSRASEATGFVVNGRERCLRAPELLERREDIVRGVWDEYAEKARGAGLPKRALLWLWAHREVRRRTRKLIAEWAPEEALY